MSATASSISKSEKKRHPKEKKNAKNAGLKKIKTAKNKQKSFLPNKKVLVKTVDSTEAVMQMKSSLVTDELQRKNNEDERTIYIKFKENLPSTVEEIKELHPDITFVRNPLLAKKKHTEGIHYAFLEFETAEICKNAMTKLTSTQFKGQDVFVDFVGVNSKNIKQNSTDTKDLNPKRLFVCGLAPGMTKSHLKEMFPKAAHADVPKKSKNFGFVQFSNAIDAKDAFDAAQDLSIARHKITVFFAKTSSNKEEVKLKKAEKRKDRKGKGSLKKDDSMLKNKLGVVKKGGSVVKKNINKKIKIKNAKAQATKHE